MGTWEGYLINLTGCKSFDVEAYKRGGSEIRTGGIREETHTHCEEF